jgi:hypothetical protein
MTLAINIDRPSKSGHELSRVPAERVFEGSRPRGGRADVRRQSCGGLSPEGRRQGEDQSSWPLVQEKSSREVLTGPLGVTVAST